MSGVPWVWPPVPPTVEEAITTDDVINTSSVPGGTASNALDLLEALSLRVQFRGYLAAAANSPNNAFGKVPIDTVSFDTGAGWNAGTLRYTPPISGYYLVVGRARTNTAGGAFTNVISVAIAKNGVLQAGIGGDSPGFAAGGSGIFTANGTTDYFELQAFTGSIRAYTVGTFDTWFSVYGPLGP
jgi:hypothetical protein